MHKFPLNKTNILTFIYLTSYKNFNFFKRGEVEEHIIMFNSKNNLCNDGCSIKV